MKVLTLMFFLFLFSNCSHSQTSLDEMRLQNNIYFEKEASVPYNGVAISKFDNGAISNRIIFKDGVPNGEWRVYGFDGEIVQSGNYVPFKIRNLAFSWSGSIERLNVCEVEEGEVSYIDIFVIVKKKLKGYTYESEKIKTDLRQVLSKNNSYLKDKIINHVKVVTGELEL